MRSNARADARAAARALETYFAEVDAETLVEEPHRAVARAFNDGFYVATARALEPLFEAPDARVMRDIAARTPCRSDPMATIRRLGRRSVCGEASTGGTPRRTTTVGVGRRRVSDAAHRARWRNDGVALLFDDDVGVEGEAPPMGGDALDEDAEIEADGGVYGMLLRAARDDRERVELPSAYALEEVRASSFPEHPCARDLARLSEAFSREDSRVGAVANASALGRGVAHVLRDERSEAVGYTLTYENTAPAWERARAVTLPPRLAHVYIRPEWRSRGLGTALTKWWMSRFALTCAYFAVDAPNTSMHRTLSKLECALATTRSGHEASSVHYVSTR